MYLKYPALGEKKNQQQCGTQKLEEISTISGSEHHI